MYSLLLPHLEAKILWFHSCGNQIGGRYHKVSQLVFIVHIPSSESESKNIEGDGLNDIRRSRDENEDEKEDIEEEVLSVQPESPCATNTTSTDPSRKQMFPVSSQ